MAGNDQLRDWIQKRVQSEKSQSPIEALLYGAYLLLQPHRVMPAEAKVTMVQQAPIGQYTADFLLGVTDKKGVRHSIVVEADGHAYHERTKEQAAHDRARDRFMTMKDYRVLRFTGSEIWANPFACAEQIFSQLEQLHFGMDRASARAAAGLAAIRAMFEDAA